MARKAVYAKKSDIPEADLPWYVEQDGAWVLDVDVEDHPKVRGLKTAYEKEHDRRKKQGERLKLFEALHHEPEDLERVIEEAEKSATGGKGKDLETWKEQTQKAHKVELDKALAKVAKRDAVLALTLGENELRKALEPKALSMTALLAIAKPRVKVEFDDESGEAKTVILDDKGKPMVTNGQGQAAGIADLIADLESKDDLKPLFKGTEARGSGSGGEKGQATVDKVIPAGDSKAFLANLDGIAKGIVAVQQ